MTEFAGNRSVLFCSLICCLIWKVLRIEVKGQTGKQISLCPGTTYKTDTFLVLAIFTSYFVYCKRKDFSTWIDWGRRRTGRELHKGEALQWRLFRIGCERRVTKGRRLGIAVSINEIWRDEEEETDKRRLKTSGRERERERKWEKR